MKKKFKLLYWEKRPLAFRKLSFERRMIGKPESVYFYAIISRSISYKSWYIQAEYTNGSFRWVSDFGFSMNPLKAMARLDKILSTRFILLSKKESDKFRNLE